MDLKHRPQYHFQPLANWMNDPNGLLWWKGRYHLFYQHNPHGPESAQKHWGHAASADMVHWTHLPIALAPTPGGPDRDGCWSGCAVDDKGTPTLVYTGVHPQVQCIATSADGMVTWSKHAGNPVIGGPPNSLEVTGFRDPYVWQQGDAWRMALGSGIRGRGGAVLLYQSQDLRGWDYLGLLCVGDEADSGTMWECPSFFPCGGKHILIVSAVPMRKALYFVGTYEGNRFSPEHAGTVDLGGHLYAPQVMVDRWGRCLMWAWLWEGRGLDAQREAGWAGTMAIPRLITVASDGTLRSEPVGGLDMLRGRNCHFEDISLSPGAAHVLGEVHSDACEIVVTFAPGEAAALGLAVRRSPEGDEQTLVELDLAKGEISVNRERSSLDSRTGRESCSAPLGTEGDSVQLRVFVDRSVIEVFADDAVCLASRVYPTRADADGLALIARGGKAIARSIDIWEMGSIWSDAN